MTEELTIPVPIRELDLDEVRRRLVAKKGWSAAHADRMVQEYREYLALFFHHPGEELVPPSQDLDDVWHEHILDTPRYAADCDRMFGRFIHHVPGLEHGTERHAEGLHRTRRHWWQIFGRHREKRLTVARDADGHVDVVTFGSSCSSFVPSAGEHSSFSGSLFGGGHSGGAGASAGFDEATGGTESGTSAEAGGGDSSGSDGGGDGGGGGGCGGGGGD